MTDPNDLTSFLEKEAHKKILIISDFEGTAPKEHFKAFEREIKEGKVIFLGDIFDNTVVFDDKNCEPRDCKNPEADNKCIKAENYCALQTIKLLVDYPDNCRYVVGNRDLNKIKLWPFFQKKNNKHKWWRYSDVKNKTEWTTYKEIVKYLLDNEEQMDWHITGKDIDLFKPFWNDKSEWKIKDNYNTDIFARFEALFGKDGAEGSMSALVTLKGIPEEIFNSIHPDPAQDNKHNTRKNFYNFINSNEDQQSLEWKKKVRAALVITIFMRMLDHELFPNIEDLHDPEKIAERRNKIVGKFGALDGYLYHYLMNAKPAYYAKYNKNILLFAHGGITPDFIKTGGNKAFEILHQVEWETIFPNVGGGDDQIESYDEIKESIETFNDNYSQYLLHFFADAYMLRALQKYMLILLQISAPDKYFAGKTEYRDKFSPIQIKEPNTPWDILDIDKSDDKIFNIFGHGSSSAGYSFGLLKYPDSDVYSKTYYINTDFSTTLYKNDISCENYNENKLLLYLTLKNKNVELNLVGTVILNKKYKHKPYDANFNNNSDLFNAFATLKDGKKATKEKPKPDYKALISIEKEDEKKIIRTLYYVHDSGEKFDNNELKYEFVEGYDLMDRMDDYSNSPPDTGAFKYNGIVLINNKQFRAYSSTFWVYDAKAGDTIYFIFLPTETVASNEESNDGGGKKQKRNRKTKRQQYKKIKTRRIQRKKKNRKTKKGKQRKNKKTKRRM
jgi:hypothetical protein